MKKRKVIGCILATSLIAYTSFNTAYTMLLKTSYQSKVKNNAIQYEESLNSYKNNVNEYAAYINSLNLSDLEIIMKVMNDTWNGIKGYGVADNLILGHYRLSFPNEGKGVCTSFADDFTSKINAINPEFQAENILVYLDSAQNEVDRVDIKRTILEINSEAQEETKQKKDFGNHMVSLLNLPSSNVKLVVDPTNLMIGTMKNGKIQMFNSQNEDIIEYRFKSNLIFSTESVVEDLLEYLESFSISRKLIKETEEMYGFESQEKAYEKIQSLSLKLEK